MTENSEQVIERGVREGKLDRVDKILEGEGASSPTPPEAFSPPSLESYPHSFPGEGIYFGMPDEEYHAVPALSCSGIRKLASSPFLYWMLCPWLNEAYEPPKDKAHFQIGKAYHARILEGDAAFHERFGVALEKDSIEGLCITIDDIKKRIAEKHGALPVGRAKQDFVDQLLELEPNAPIWDVLRERHAEENAGRTLLPLDVVVRIEVAAKAIEAHPELSKVLRAGYPEVSLFWIDQRTGVPMKARADWLKVKGIVDLKSYENKFDLSPGEAIRKAIANNRYNLQPSVYFAGAERVRQVVRSHGASAVHWWPAVTHGDLTGAEAAIAFALKWADWNEPDEWLWIFQQKGVAPITRGVGYPRGGTTKMLSDEIVSRMVKRYRDFSVAFGTDAWLDIEPIYDIADEDIPPWATEI